MFPITAFRYMLVNENSVLETIHVLSFLIHISKLYFKTVLTYVSPNNIWEGHFSNILMNTGNSQGEALLPILYVY